MKPIFKFALRLFLIITIFAFFLNVIMTYLWDDEIKLLLNFIKSIFFGIFMSAITTKMQESSLAEAGISGITDEYLKPYAEHEIKTAIKQEEIVKKLKTNVAFNDIKTKDNSIFFKIGLSMHSFGEKIEIETIKEEENFYTYRIKSRSSFGLTFADYGINRKNVNKVINIIYG